jgi:murein DD-endopeptidase MepM/ murein hydrolase activator NlpD
MFKIVFQLGSVLLLTLLASCARAPGACPEQIPADLTRAGDFATRDGLPFQMPLAGTEAGMPPISTGFCASGRGKSGHEFHAAEDFLQPAGTPVYAVTDGELSFSGPMGGYGWLIIIDHPQANLYSLYGHLSPSRWRREPGPVRKGDLLGYLGDADENGGSPERPLRPHLHFGIRTGQRADYPGKGEWRWQAGWIGPCPAELGWLKPSAIITGQEIPPGGFQEPAGDFLGKWGVELFFTGIYTACSLTMLVYSNRWKKPHLLVLGGFVLLAAGWIFHRDGWKVAPVLFTLAALLLSVGAAGLLRRWRPLPPAQI